MAELPKDMIFHYYSDDGITIKLDATELVRCGECKYRDPENGFCTGRGWPMQLVPDDGFCDKGERRTDE